MLWRTTTQNESVQCRMKAYNLEDLTSLEFPGEILHLNSEENGGGGGNVPGRGGSMGRGSEGDRMLLYSETEN